MTLGEALAEGIQLLREHHVPSPGLDAELLLAHCLGVDRPYLHAHRNDSMAPAKKRDYDGLLDRRASREPLQYITGRQEFYGRPFSVNPSVLIPRPETEFVVEAVCRLNTWARPRILDVGTGSGCLAVTLALEVPGARVFAGDLDYSPLNTARRNARALGALVQFACVDGLSAWGRGFEFVVSNPPYVSLSERDGLQPEIRDHEPHLALFGRQDPLRLYQQLIGAAEQRLVQGGFLVVEIGYTMEEAVLRMLDHAWERSTTITDLRGVPRVVTALRR